MWLLDTKTGDLAPTRDSYAILSHVWSVSGEQSFQELRRLTPNTGLDGASAKSRNCCLFAERHGYRKVWIDSCCIDKTSSAELSEAINSMYLWYGQADTCLVFLEDVAADHDPRHPRSQFRRSKWFRRGWTLQELIAPRNILFLSRDWQMLGTKISLADVIEEVTGIDRAILAHQRPLNSVSVAQRMSWASCRETTRLEDEAYSLMGLFDIHMPTLYGEGRRAFTRLQEEILRRIPDQSIFVWGLYPHKPEEDLVATELLEPNTEENTDLLLAESPGDFANSSTITTVPIESVAREFEEFLTFVPEFTITSHGVRSRLLLIPFKYGTSLITQAAVLPCRDSEGGLLALLLRPSDDGSATTRYLVGNRRFLQHIRVTTLSGLESIGALAGQATVQEVYIPYMRSAPLPTLPLRPSSSANISTGPSIPFKAIPCPCQIVLPAWVHSDLLEQEYEVTLNGEPYGEPHEDMLLDVNAGTYISSRYILSSKPVVGLHRGDGRILIELFSSHRPHYLSAKLVWYGTEKPPVDSEDGSAEEPEHSEEAESIWAGVTHTFWSSSGTRTVRLAFNPWGNDKYALDISVTHAQAEGFASASRVPTPIPVTFPFSGAGRSGHGYPLARRGLPGPRDRMNLAATALAGLTIHEDDDEASIENTSGVV